MDAIDSLGTPDDEVTTTIDVSAHVDTKIASLQVPPHPDQRRRPLLPTPQDIMAGLMGTEYYQLAAPPGATDLLATL